MFDKIIEHSKMFEKLAAFDPQEPENLELMSNLEDKFSEPNEDDKNLIMRLIKSATSSLREGNISVFAKSFSDLDSYIRNLMHESFTPQFYDLISDENMLEWIYSVKSKSEYSDYDLEASKFVLNDLVTFDSVDKVFL